MLFKLLGVLLLSSQLCFESSLGREVGESQLSEPTLGLADLVSQTPAQFVGPACFTLPSGAPTRAGVGISQHRSSLPGDLPSWTPSPQ